MNNQHNEVTKVIRNIEDAADFAAFCKRVRDAAERALKTPIENINSAADTLMKVIEDERPLGNSHE